MPLRVGYVRGVTPDKWARIWRQRHGQAPALVPVREQDQESRLRSGEVDVALVRLPIDRGGLHVVELYDELVVAVASVGHVLAAATEITTAELADEQLVLPHRSGWTPQAAQLEWPRMGEAQAVATVATGTGVALMPMSVARLHHRKDTTYRIVTDLEPTRIALAWLVERDGDVIQDFVGVARGRSARSSR